MYWNHSGVWSPFNELRGLQREMNRLFDGYERDPGVSRFPAMNMWGNNERLVVTAELPGVDVNQVDISVAGHELTVKGEYQLDQPADDVVCHRSERNTGKFVRTVRLPFAVESERISAMYAMGVLTIDMPRSEAAKPKRIEIQTAKEG